MTHVHTSVRPFKWEGDLLAGHLQMIDQRELPHAERWHSYDDAQGVAGAITDMVVRGAPAIGIAAAYGVVLGARAWGSSPHTPEQAHALLELLANTRPTAVNLFWALQKMRATLEAHQAGGPQRLEALMAQAQGIEQDDLRDNLRMGEFGAGLMPARARILTHCNTGGLATAGYGTALGVIRATHAQGKLGHVLIDETRPYLQGARLTAWECLKDALPCTLITDSMAAYFMAKGEVDAVIVGADRVAANGDAANKIGTYGLAVLCAYHDIPFYVAAPLSTIDPQIPDGSHIPIEQRSAREVTHVRTVSIAPQDVPVAHPAFDVTPSALITALITQHGVIQAPYNQGIARQLADHPH